MSDKPFFDTTILIYAVTDDASRSSIAEQLLMQGGCISVQVLNEFAAVAKRKLRMPWADISQAIESVRVLCEPVAPVSVETHVDAVAIASKTGYHIYDALILASAIENGCSVLYSEDMQDGHILQELTIRNPFAC